MELIYKKASEKDIEALIELKIKQNKYTCNIEKKVFKNEDIVRKNIKKVLLQELNKTIYFFVAIDKSNNKVIASNGVVIQQMVPSIFCLDGRKAYITCVYTEEEYRHKGIQNKLMEIVLDFVKEIKCKLIELDAVNPFAISLYEKFGFKKDDEKYIQIL